MYIFSFKSEYKLSCETICKLIKFQNYKGVGSGVEGREGTKYQENLQQVFAKYGWSGKSEPGLIIHT